MSIYEFIILCSLAPIYRFHMINSSKLKNYLSSLLISMSPLHAVPATPPLPIYLQFTPMTVPLTLTHILKSRFPYPILSHSTSLYMLKLQHVFWNRNLITSSYWSWPFWFLRLNNALGRNIRTLMSWPLFTLTSFLSKPYNPSNILFPKHCSHLYFWTNTFYFLSLKMAYSNSSSHLYFY